MAVGLVLIASLGGLVAAFSYALFGGGTLLGALGVYVGAQVALGMVLMAALAWRAHGAERRGNRMDMRVLGPTAGGAGRGSDL